MSGNIWIAGKPVIGENTYTAYIPRSVASGPAGARRSRNMVRLDRCENDAVLCSDFLAVQLELGRPIVVPDLLTAWTMPVKSLTWRGGKLPMTSDLSRPIRSHSARG